MRGPRLDPFWSGLGAAVVLVVVMCAVVISGIPGGPQIPLPWNQKETLKVVLADADALAPHASVEIAGVKVGEVESVAAQGSQAVATLQIEKQYSDIHSDATVYLRAHGLFGPKYIAIVTGTSSAPVLQDGATIPVNQTVQPVDLDAILQDLQAPEQQNLRTAIVELGQASAGQGDDVNHLLAAADSLSQVLASPLRAADAVSPQLSDMLVKDEQFNDYFAQTPLDQLVANSEQTVQAFAANASHLESLLVHADSALTTLDAALAGQSGNISTIIRELGTQNSGTLYKLEQFTYLLGLFGENLTGQERSSDPADLDVVNGIIGAIENVRSAFYYSEPCPATSTSANDNHCSESPDHRQHYLDVRTFGVTPATTIPGPPNSACTPPLPPNNQPICLSNFAELASPNLPHFAGDEMEAFAALFAD